MALTNTNPINAQNAQKTGNAIRALGRMASLSASSRRNVSPVTVVPLKDEPPLEDEVIPKTDTFNGVTGIVEKIVLRPAVDLKGDTSICNERSDSGFIEAPFVHRGSVEFHAVNDCIEEEPIETVSVIETETVKEVEVKTKFNEVPLKTAFIPKITDKNPKKVVATTEPVKTVTKSTPDISEDHTPQPSNDIPIATTSINRTQSLQHRKPPIDKDMVRRSDFTNTIQMRKKSLENSVFKERMSFSRSILKPTGKVFNLMQKFATAQLTAPSKVDMVDHDATPTSDEVITFTAPPHTVVEVADNHVVVEENTVVNSDLIENNITVDQIVRPTVDLSNSDNAVSSTASRMKPNTKKATVVPSVFKRLTTTNKSMEKTTRPPTKPTTKTDDNKINRSKIPTANGNDHNVKSNGTGTAKSPSPSFQRASAVRLSARVKEVTERLSTPKSPKSKEASPIKITKPKSPKISNDKYRQYRNLFNADEIKGTK